MRFIKKQFALWRIVLVIGVIAVVIPIAAHISPNTTAVVGQRHEYLVQPTANDNEYADAKHGKDSKATVGRVGRPQDDYYERRRQYWEKRVDGRLEDLDEEESGDADSEDSKDKKDSKAADKEDTVDSEEELIERRREYWRDRLDREW